MLKEVFKYNGTWSFFGQLQKPRRSHSAIYWNGSVFVFGGTGKHKDNLKTEIWNISARVCDLNFSFITCPIRGPRFPRELAVQYYLSHPVHKL